MDELCSCYVDKLASGRIDILKADISAYICVNSLCSELYWTALSLHWFAFVITCVVWCRFMVMSVFWLVLCFASNFENCVSFDQSMHVWEFGCTQVCFCRFAGVLYKYIIQMLRDLSWWCCFFDPYVFWPINSENYLT